MKKVTGSGELKSAVGASPKSVVLYHATWCPFCRAFRPTFDKLTAGGAWDAVEAVIDDEENPIWTEQRIDIVPTVVFYEGGKPVRRLDGRAGVGIAEAELRDAMR
jgi:thioredoxin 1